MRITQCQRRVSRREPHHARRHAPIPAHGTPAMNSQRNPKLLEMGTNSPLALSVMSLPLKKLGHCIQPRAPERPIPTVSASTIHPES
jgi:hypothetical protein